MASSEPGTPGTEAGRTFLEDYPHIGHLIYGSTGLPIIAAIEAEAIASERARVREAVEGLPTFFDDGRSLDRGAVFAVIDGAS